jgi:hypothetical protein
LNRRKQAVAGRHATGTILGDGVWARAHRAPVVLDHTAWARVARARARARVDRDHMDQAKHASSHECCMCAPRRPILGPRLPNERGQRGASVGSGSTPTCSTCRRVCVPAAGVSAVCAPCTISVVFGPDTGGRRSSERGACASKRPACPSALSDVPGSENLSSWCVCVCVPPWPGCLDHLAPEFPGIQNSGASGACLRCCSHIQSLSATTTHARAAVRYRVQAQERALQAAAAAARRAEDLRWVCVCHLLCQVADT